MKWKNPNLFFDISNTFRDVSFHDPIGRDSVTLNKVSCLDKYNFSKHPTHSISCGDIKYPTDERNTTIFIVYSFVLKIKINKDKKNVKIVGIHAKIEVMYLLH